MLRTIKIFTLFILSSSLWLACGDNESKQESEKKDTVSQETTKKDSEIKKEEPKPEVSEADLKNFMYSKEGTYGWQTTSDNLGIDFFKDGRLAVQGPGGESEMWVGKWSLTGDQLTMECKDCGKMKEKETVTVKIEGENLILGSKTYTRYAPR
ncbi:MAG: hypothetical protein MUE85_06935 [Microscillaceae bacterium]|jgi:hypothetical protein|nr:hypothetical protein [Microscillaceae bacterium]